MEIFVEIVVGQKIDKGNHLYALSIKMQNARKDRLGQPSTKSIFEVNAAFRLKESNISRNAETIKSRMKIFLESAKEFLEIYRKDSSEKINLKVYMDNQADYLESEEKFKTFINSVFNKIENVEIIFN